MKFVDDAIFFASRRLTLTVFWIWFSCSGLSAVASTNSMVQFSSRTWQTDEGLPQNAVQALAQTRDGYLWVGTLRGLARFDGARFTVYEPGNTPELRHASITALCQCRDGSLWIGTAGGGLTRLQEGRFTHHELGTEGRAATIKCILEGGDGSLWVGTLAGLFRHQRGVWTRFTVKEGLLDNVVRSLCEVGDQLWIGTGSGLNVWKNGVMSAQSGLEGRSVRVVFEDARGRLWVGLTEGLACVSAGQVTFYSRLDGLPDNNVAAVFEDKRANLWVGTYGGLSRWREEGRFVVEKDSQGGFYDQVNALLEDREGDLWVGARDGLHELRAKRFVTYTRQQGLPHNNTISVLEDHTGNLWISTWGGGLVRLKGEEATEYSKETGMSNGLGSDLLLALCEDRDGSILVGTDYEGGVYRFSEGRFSRLWSREESLSNRVIRVICRDREGNLWFGLSPGLVLWGSREKFLERATIHCILEDGEGTLWVGSNDGLFRRTREGRFVRFTAGGLSHDTVSALFEDRQGTLWIGTEGKGLCRQKEGSFATYTTRQGLWSDEIFEILEDDYGWLWLSSPKGVFRVLKRNLEELDRKQSSTIGSIAYGKADGLESLQCSGVAKPAAWKSHDGRLWFATTKGVAVTDPHSGLGLNEEPPPVRIEEVLSDQEPLDMASQSPLAVGPGRGELEFHYTALSLALPENNRFRYRLEGVDSEWVEAGARRVAYYNNLRPGSYRFRVQACNNDGVWNTTGAQLEFTLLPHFWQTWWFMGSIALFGVAAAGGTVRYNTKKKVQSELKRLEQQHAIEQERIRIARDMHDEIGAKLTKISFLGALAKRKLDVPGEAERQIDKMSQTAREMIGALDEIVWAVNPANDTLDHLATYLCRYASEFFENSPVLCQFDIPAQLPNCRLSTEERHNIFLAAKEALNNVLKHAEATNLRLKISVQGDVCEIAIMDNGRGFREWKTSKQNCAAGEWAARIGNGLNNMQQRLAAIGGQCLVESQGGHGTRVVFTVNLSEGVKI